jgi:hypothetical protein
MLSQTPAVRSSMPDFYEKMKDRLRTAEQGADTASWLVNMNCYFALVILKF